MGILTAVAGLGIIGALMGSAFAILVVVANCFLYTKMGEPWWKAIIPFYNLFVINEKIFGNGWWFLITAFGAVPYVGWIVCLLYSVIFNVRLARSFGKESVFALGLILLSPIFILILGLGQARYVRLADFDYKRPFAEF